MTRSKASKTRLRVAKHPLYGVWLNMRRRCYEPSHHQFHRYGGRGIKVCAAWRKSSASFIRWALANGWMQGLQLDRRDNDGPYSPGNCRFVTGRENALNKSNTRFLDDGTPAVLVAQKNGVSASVVGGRLKRGWTLEEAVAPVRVRHRMPDGSLAVDAAKANGISPMAFVTRIRRGWSVADAASKPYPVRRSRPDPERPELPRMPDGSLAVRTAIANGISPILFASRIKLGWPLMEAVSLPPGTHRRKPK